MRFDFQFGTSSQDELGRKPVYMLPQQQHCQLPVDPTLGTVGESQPLQRFMQDENHLFFNFEPVPAPRLQYPSVLSHAQTQGPSPSSQYQLSGTSNSQSPRTEVDMFRDSSYGPATPPHMRSPPFPAVRDLDDSRDNLFSIIGCTARYVNLSEIVPSQTSLEDFQDVNPNGEFPLSQGPGLGVDVSSPSPPYENSVPQANVRLCSPIIDYPDPAEMEDDKHDSPTLKEEEEDGDYKPTPSRRKSSLPKRKGRGRPKGSTSKVTKAKIPSRSASTGASSSPSTGSLYKCAQCPGSFFRKVADLKKHSKSDHKRSFTCIFQFAGCSDVFSSKNEWKRHVATQHMNTIFWLCLNGTCRREESHEGQNFTNGRPFKRKDLFIQHARRMHVTSCSAEVAKMPKNRCQGLDDELEAMQKDAHHKRCDTPEFMQCPGEYCFKEFSGERAWDEYLEHIASDHLDPTGRHHYPPVQFGSARNKAFIDWVSSDPVNVIRPTSTGWELCDPLKDICLVRDESTDEM